MSTEKALLAGVIANPHEDTPRLVYADWLQENGNEARAEFIRVQCVLAQKRLPTGSMPRRQLQNQQRALFSAHAESWAAIYGKWCEVELDYWRRGFPVEARIFNTPYAAPPPLNRVLKEIRQACASAPIEAVALHLPVADAKGIKAIASLAELSRLRRLEIWGSHHSDLKSAASERSVALALLSSAHLTNLEELELRQMAGGPALFQAVLGFNRLRSLYIYMAEMDDEAARLLARSAIARSLEKLCLGADFTAEAAEAVAREPAFANLRVLDFDNSSIGDDGAVALAGAAHLSGLRELRLNNCGIGDRGFTALANSRSLAGLRVLVLSQNEGVAWSGIQAMRRSKTLARTLQLDLWRCYDEPSVHKSLRKRFPRVNFDR